MTENDIHTPPQWAANKEMSFWQAALALRYLTSMDSIEGWLSIDTAYALIALSREQVRLRLTPGVAEIGVHHGKSFLALLAGTEPDEKSTAIDVFERQDLNVDYSGAGNRDIFLANVSRFFPDVEPRLIATSSETLRGAETEHGLHDLRLMSVDGGHTMGLTLNDLKIAERTLGAGGICALDDVLNSHWTGVISGLFRYVYDGGTLIPFAMVPNKLLLCRREYLEHYRTFMRCRFSYAVEKNNVELAGYDIDVFGPIWQPMNGHTGGLAYLVSLVIAATDLTDRIAGLETQLMYERSRTEALLGSRSWRVTEPLRTVSKAFKRAK